MTTDNQLYENYRIQAFSVILAHENRTSLFCHYRSCNKVNVTIQGVFG